MSINGVVINIGASPLSDFLTGAYGLESGSYEQNINGDGKLSLSWRSTEGGGITAGTEATVAEGNVTLRYYMKDNYTPTPNGDGTYTWSPTFVSVDSKMKGVLVYLQTNIYRQFGKNASQTKAVKLYTFPYTGQAGTLVTSLNGCDGVNGKIDLSGSFASSIVTVSFDQDNIVSAAQKIASALGTNCTIENGTVKIGHHTALAVSEYYDRFVVLGGTRNMGKYVMDSDKYAAVTMRLALDETSYPDSIMPANTPAAGHMTKVLIFDDIYPEMKLKIASVRARVCYMFDKDGKPLIVDGAQKTYTKYYVRLALPDGTAYSFDVKTVIEGRTLGMVFHSGLLTGREFDLSYYQNTVDEYDSEEDVSQTEARGYAGDFRIDLVADGDTLLPNSTLAPQAGDEVTLTGVALDGAYEVDAKRRLLAAAQPYVDMYMSRQPTDVTMEEQEVVTDFLTGESHVTAGTSVGSTTEDYVTTSVTTDILTGRQTVRLGTFEPQGKIASMANQIESATVSGGGGTTGSGEDNVRHTASMSLDQFKTLFDIYGRLGMKTVNQRIDSNGVLIEALQEALSAVQEQSDKSFDIWFSEGTPSPLISNPTATASFPSSEWTSTEDKEKHLQDIYYDLTRPAGGTGGRAWRWVSAKDANNNTIYGWDEVLDADTIAALDQISDLSNDGVLTPSEKLVARRDWAQVIGEYPDLVLRASEAEVSSAEYCNAFYCLWLYLNETTDAMHTAAWDAYEILSDDEVTQAEFTEAATLLSGYTSENTNISNAYNYVTQSKAKEAVASLILYFAGCFSSNDMAAPAKLTAVGNTTISGTTYKQLWSDYRNTKTVLMTALSDKSIKELDDLASDNVLTDIEKITVIREYERIKQETAELLTRAAEAGLPNTNGSTLYAYCVAYSALYAYLNILATSSYNILTVDLSQISNPEMLYNGETTTIVGTTFKGKFSDYYTAASNLRKAIQAAGPKVFSTTYQSTPPNPVPPYKAGDLWIHTDSDGNTTLRMCVNGRASGNYVDTDWAENEFYNDPRSILAALADAVYKAANPNPQSEGELATVDLSQEYNIDIITPASGISLSGMVDVSDMLITLKAFIGEVTFGIYYISGGGDRMYDLRCTPVMTPIPGSQESIVGGITIQMFNGVSWEYIQQSTSALLNNLGTAVNAIVFGSNNAATEAAGLTVGQKFAKLFAQATVWDDTANGGQGGYVSLTEALFGLSIEKDQNTGKYYSTALLRADKIDFTAGTFSIAADKIDFTANNFKLNANYIDFNAQGFSLSANKVDFTAQGFSIDASKITFTSGGSSVSISDHLVSLLVNNLADATSGSTDTANLQKQLGMVIRQDGQNGQFSFGTLDSNGNFVAGLNFLTSSGATKLQLTANNASIDADSISFAGKTINLTAQSGLIISGGTLTLASDSTIDMSAANVILGADKIGFAGKSIALDASQTLSFEGGIISFVAGGNGNLGTVNFSGIGTLNLNADTVSLNANKLTWNNQTIISGDDGTGTSTNETKFGTDSNGNVTMNHATMNNATVNGAITANTGFIGGTNGWTIAAQKLYTGTQGSDNSLYLTTADLAQADAVTIAGHQDTEWRLTIGQNFGITKNGLVYSNGGTFTGTIYASGGAITGDLSIGELSSNYLSLNPDSGGAYIEGKKYDTSQSENVTKFVLGFGGASFFSQYKDNGFLAMGRSLFTDGFMKVGGKANGVGFIPTVAEDIYAYLQAYDPAASSLLNHGPSLMLCHKISSTKNTFEILVNTSGKAVISSNCWPTSSSDVPVGGVYLDGTTLRVRTS